jgi:hypothetical protein
LNHVTRVDIGLILRFLFTENQVILIVFIFIVLFLYHLIWIILSRLMIWVILNRLMIWIILAILIIWVIIIKWKRLVVDHSRFDKFWEVSIDGLNHGISVQIICLEHKNVCMLVYWIC